jgi:hypothetical protein
LPPAPSLRPKFGRVLAAFASSVAGCSRPPFPIDAGANRRTRRSRLHGALQGKSIRTKTQCGRNLTNVRFDVEHEMADIAWNLPKLVDGFRWIGDDVQTESGYEQGTTHRDVRIVVGPWSTRNGVTCLSGYVMLQ